MATCHVDFTVTLCEPKLVLILATRSLTCQHTFWWNTLFSLIFWCPKILSYHCFEHINFLQRLRRNRHAAIFYAVVKSSAQPKRSFSSAINFFLLMIEMKNMISYKPLNWIFLTFIYFHCACDTRFLGNVFITSKKRFKPLNLFFFNDVPILIWYWRNSIALNSFLWKRMLYCYMPQRSLNSFYLRVVAV